MKFKKHKIVGAFVCLGLFASSVASCLVANSNAIQAFAEDAYPVKVLNSLSAPSQLGTVAIAVGEGKIDVAAAVYGGVTYTYSGSGSYGYKTIISPTSDIVSIGIHFSIGDSVEKTGTDSDLSTLGGYQVHLAGWGTTLSLSKGGVEIASAADITCATGTQHEVEFHMVDVDENSTRVIFKYDGVEKINYLDETNPLKPTSTSGILYNTIWSQWVGFSVYEMEVPPEAPEYPVSPLTYFSEPYGFAGSELAITDNKIATGSATYSGAFFTRSATGSYGYTASVSMNAMAGSTSFIIGDPVAKVGGWQDYGANGGYTVVLGDWGTTLTLKKGETVLASSATSWVAEQIYNIEFDMVDVDENSTRVIFKVDGAEKINYLDSESPLKPTSDSGVLHNIIWGYWTIVSIERDPVSSALLETFSAPSQLGETPITVGTEKIDVPGAAYGGVVYSYGGVGSYGYKTTISSSTTFSTVGIRFAIGDRSAKNGTSTDFTGLAGYQINWANWGTTAYLSKAGVALASAPTPVFAANTEYKIELDMIEENYFATRVIFKINDAIVLSYLDTENPLHVNSEAGTLYNVIWSEWVPFSVHFDTLLLAKNDAKATLDAVDLTVYRDAEKTTVSGLISSGKTAIDACTSVDDVNDALAAVLADIAAVKTDAQYQAEEAAAALAKAKTDAKAELDATDLTIYRTAEKTTVEGLIADGKTAIDACEATDAVATKLSEVKADIAAIKTDAQYQAEEDAAAAAAALAQAKTDAKAELDTTDLTIYRDAEKTTVEGLISAGKTAIDSCDSILNVNNKLAEVKADIAAVKTDAQYQVEEALAQAKTDAKAELDAVDVTVYRDAEKATVQGLVNNGKTAIDACTTIEAVNSKLAEVKADIAAVKTDAEYQAEEAAAALSQAKTDAKAELDSINLVVYRKAQKATIQSIIADAKEAIDACDTIEAIAPIVSDAKDDISNIPTDADLYKDEVFVYTVSPANEYSNAAIFAGSPFVTFNDDVISMAANAYAGVDYTFMGQGSYGYSVVIRSNSIIESTGVHFTIGDPVAKVGGWQDYGTNGGYQVYWTGWGTQLVLSKNGVNLLVVDGLSFAANTEYNIEFIMIDVDENSTRVIFKINDDIKVNYLDEEEPLKPTSDTNILHNTIWSEWFAFDILEAEITPFPAVVIDSLSEPTQLGTVQVTYGEKTIDVPNNVYGGVIFTYEGNDSYGYKTAFKATSQITSVGINFSIGDTVSKAGADADFFALGGYQVHLAGWGTTLSLTKGDSTLITVTIPAIALNTEYEVEFDMIVVSESATRVVFKLNGETKINFLDADSPLTIGSEKASYYNVIWSEYVAFSLRVDELIKAQRDACAELDAIDLTLYREAEQTTVEGLISEGKDAIILCESVEDVADALAKAKASIAAVKTDAQYQEEEEAAALEQTKIDAKAELDATDLTVYRDAEKATVQGLISDGKTAIDACETTKAVAAKLNEIKASIAAVKTDAQYQAEEALAQAKADAKTELDATDLTVYRDAEKATVQGLIAAGKEAIDACETPEAVAAKLDEIKASIAAVKTDADYQKEEEEAAAAAALAKAKTDAKAELDNVDLNAYRDAEKIQVRSLVASGKNAIDACTTPEAVADKLAEAKAAIAEVKTDAQYQKEEAAAALAKAKTDAKAELDNVDLTVYRDAEKANVQGLIAAGKEAVDACETPEAVAAKLDEIKASIAAVKTDAQYQAEEALAQAKADAKAELDNVDLTVYREAEKTTVQGLVNNGKTAIDACATIEAVNSKLAEVKAAIAEVKTDADYQKEETLVSITVTSKPNKTEYKVGEAFDPTGLVITATYANGTTKTIDAYELSGFNSANAGKVTVNVTFEGKTTSFEIDVNQAAGCRGNIVASSAILSVLSLMGIALLVIKKSKKKFAK